MTHPPFPVSRETLHRLEVYEDLLIKWSEKMNLVSRETLPQIWTRHFWDSAQISSHVGDFHSSVVDLGSGAGFPGMVLAAMGHERMTLVEKDKKKISFLKNVSAHLNLSVALIPDRFEAISPFVCDVVVSRACAPLELLLSYSQTFTGPHSRCIFLKGQGWQDELNEALQTYVFEWDVHSSVTQENAKILIIKGVKSRQ